MSCARDREELTAYLDRELPEQQGVALRRHMEDCAVCAKTLADLEKADRYLEQLPPPPKPAANFVERFRRTARALPRAGWAAARVRPWAIPAMLGGLVAASLIALVVLPEGETPVRPAESAAGLTEDEREIVAQLDVLEAEEYETALSLPILSSLPAVLEADETELDILAKEGSE